MSWCEVDWAEILARQVVRAEKAEAETAALRARVAELEGLLVRWRARGFPMGGSDLWDDTLAALGAKPSPSVSGAIEVRASLAVPEDEVWLADGKGGGVRMKVGVGDDGFNCCGGNDEEPRHHCSDCPEHPWTGSPPTGSEAKP